MNDREHFSFVLEQNDAIGMARRNAELIVKYTTAFPFRLPEDTMVCVFCYENFDDPAMFRKHMFDKHEMFKIRTAFMHCREGNLKVDITDLRCRLCPKHFQSLIDIAKHLHDDHGQPFDLSYDLGLNPFKLQKGTFTCAICSRKLVSLRQLSRHTQTHFLNYTCEACGKSYSTLTTLRHHIRFSHKGEEKICRKCRKTFTSNKARREHIEESKKCWPVLCKICEKRFPTRKSKEDHLTEVHGTEKKSVCPECGEVFYERKKYRIHFNTMHTNNFICTYCERKFLSMRTLQEHKVMHTKEKLFPCLMCSKSFPRKKNLTQHMWIHSESKRFHCTLCNKQFNQRVSWRTHMNSHHPDLDNYEDMLNKDATLIFNSTKAE